VLSIKRELIASFGRPRPKFFCESFLQSSM
jgi:hypothetical protein